MLGNEVIMKININLGIPNAFSKNTNLFYELPDGTISQENPFEDNLNGIGKGNRI